MKKKVDKERFIHPIWRHLFLYQFSLSGARLISKSFINFSGGFITWEEFFWTFLDKLSSVVIEHPFYPSASHSEWNYHDNHRKEQHLSSYKAFEFVLSCENCFGIMSFKMCLCRCLSAGTDRVKGFIPLSYCLYLFWWLRMTSKSTFCRIQKPKTQQHIQIELGVTVRHQVIHHTNH